MPTDQPDQDSEARPNTSEEPIRRKRLKREKPEIDYPSFAKPEMNPLSSRAKKKGAILSKRGEVLRKLGVVESDLAKVPKIRKLVRDAVGTIGESIAILESDDNPDSLRFMEKWKSLTVREQREAHLEDVIISAGLTGRRFLELLAGASYDQTATVGKIFTAVSQLKVLKSTVKAATDEQPIYDSQGKIVGKTNGDVKAMEIFHKITGALPTPKGSNFTFAPQIGREEEEKTERQPLQTMDSWLLEIDDVRKPRQLKAPVEPLIPVEMPANAPEIEYLGIDE